MNNYNFTPNDIEATLHEQNLLIKQLLFHDDGIASLPDLKYLTHKNYLSRCNLIDDNPTSAVMDHMGTLIVMLKTFCTHYIVSGHS